MPDGGGGSQTISQQSSDPWSGQAPYLNDINAQARAQFEGPGAQYYPGQTVAGFSPEQQTAMQATAQRAAQGSPLTDAANTQALGTIQGDYLNSNPGAQAFSGLVGLSGYGNNPTNQYFTPFASGSMGGQNPAQSGFGNFAAGQYQNTAAQPYLAGLNFGSGPSAQYLPGIASGSAGSNLDDVFSAVQSRVQPAIASQYEAAGRTPTGGQGYAENLSRGLTEGFAPYALQAAQQNIQNQLQATGQLQNAFDTGQGRALQAGGLAGQIGAQNIGNQLAGLSGLSGVYGQDIANQLGAAGQLQGAYGTGLSAQLSAAQGLGGLSDAERARQQQAIFGAPSLAQNDYFDIGQLYNVGAQNQAQQQALINADQQRYNYYQNLPNQMLQQYAQYILGGGSPGGTTTTTGPSASGLQTGLGAGLGLLGTLGQAGLFQNSTGGGLLSGLF